MKRIWKYLASKPWIRFLAAAVVFLVGGFLFGRRFPGRPATPAGTSGPTRTPAEATEDRAEVREDLAEDIEILNDATDEREAEVRKRWTDL